MNRRQFVGQMAASAALAYGGSAAATVMKSGVTNTPDGPRPVLRAYVVQPERVVQDCPNWCWAASCAMIFAMYQHPTDQLQIVDKVFGKLQCQGANQLVMQDVLSASWRDKLGNDFGSRVTARYAPASGIVSINKALIVELLTDNKPILYANTHHAMVIVSADYVETDSGPNVMSLGVLDPWPASQPYHPLTPAEMIPIHQGGQMTFLASVDIAR